MHVDCSFEASKIGWVPIDDSTSRMEWLPVSCPFRRDLHVCLYSLDGVSRRELGELEEHESLVAIVDKCSADTRTGPC